MMRLSQPRRGMAMIAAIVALAVVSITTTIIVRDLVVQRRLLERRHRQLQAAALARAGVERAAARLLADSAYNGESLALLPLSSLIITVQREPGDVFHVTSVGRFSTDVPAPVTDTLVQRIRRVAQDGDVRLEFLSAEAAEPEKPN